MPSITGVRLTSIAAAVLLLMVNAQADSVWPTTQLAPGGYSGAINTPTADVLPWGAASVGLTNSNPERKRLSQVGSFGSLNAGVGLLPGLELVGRLAYEGDLNCSAFSNGCDARQRDLSVSGKYQLPLTLPLDTRLAIGFTDVGGAATNYRQYYGVATSGTGPVDLSLGYSKAQSPQALMSGLFGSAVLRMTDRWAAVVENDTREWRAGTHYTQPLTDAASLQVGISRKLTDRNVQQPWQATVALNIALGGRNHERPKSMGYVSPVEQPNPAASIHMAPKQDGDATKAIQPEPVAAANVLAAALTAESLAADLVANGFTQVSVRHWPAKDERPGMWQVQAEPRRWRQSHADAVGMALARWMKLQAHQASKGQDELLLTLTFQRKPMLHVRTSAACLESWLGGWGRCDVGAEGTTGKPVRLSNLARMPWSSDLPKGSPAEEAVQEGAAPWMPQIEIGPNLRTAVGTEYGLFDYSLALDVGMEVGLAPGLFWQGVYSTPISRSDDFAPGGAFADRRHPGAGMDTSLLTYWRPLPGGLAAQAAAGRITRHETGGQLDGLWLSPDGRWRVSGMVGRYGSDLDTRVRKPAFGALRYSVIPGAWQLEGMTGRFMSGDEGYKLMSHHWLGDVRFSMYYRRSATPERLVMPSRQFLGFELSIPLGPKTAAQLGTVTVRGSDRWDIGLETKVGEGDNVITAGYGVMPRVRHGLSADVTGHDRSGVSDLEAQLPRVRAWLLQQK